MAEKNTGTQANSQQEPGGTAGQQNSQQTGSQPAAGNAAPGAGQQSSQPEFDYEKLAALINGKQTVTEDTVLKSYFRQQGLSAEEAAQAIQAFKEQKAKNTPDVSGLQAQLTQAQAALQQANVRQETMLLASEIGVEMKNVDYLLKLADLSKVHSESGEVDKEALKQALTKVLKDVPGLKTATAANSGFTQVGAAASAGGQTQETAGAKPVAAKRWNRFN